MGEINASSCHKKELLSFEGAIKTVNNHPIMRIDIQNSCLTLNKNASRNVSYFVYHCILLIVRVLFRNFQNLAMA